MSPSNLFGLLCQAAHYRNQGDANCMIFCNVGRPEKVLTYEELLDYAELGADYLKSLVNVDGKVVVLYLDGHLEGITWFWISVTAGAVPCILPSLSKDFEQRKKTLQEIQKLLDNPLVITTNTLRPEFEGVPKLCVVTISDIWSINVPSLDNDRFPGTFKNPDDVAVLMLTSGSTGASKAVCLQHNQLLRSLKGKSLHHQTNKDDVFLNWIGLDHVANLTEIHLHALSMSALQIHVPGAIFLSEPFRFLEAIHKHQVSYTFSVNSFLAKLVLALESSTTISPDTFELSSLRALISGGEATVVDTCVKLTTFLHAFGAPKCFIRPAFGMTETCAGSIYNTNDCPGYDFYHNLEFANLGKCISGIRMRVSLENGTQAGENEVGILEVSGPVVFKKYYNDNASTLSSFTADGWFQTGDLGMIDGDGRLRLLGRGKDTININGISHNPFAIEAALDEASIPGLEASFTVVFSHRPLGSETERLVVVFLPTYHPDDAKSRIDTAEAISKAVILYSGVRPHKIIPLEVALLPKSSLGKLPRSKIRQAFEKGEYRKYHEIDEKIIHEHKEAKEPAATATEKLVLDVCTKTTDIGINDDIFKIGASSIDLIQLKFFMQKKFNFPAEQPITAFFSCPIIKDLARALDHLQERKGFDPIVVLQAHGAKTPLFFIHPGLGEILIFIDIARYFPDRPVYAIRARGFDNEPFFTSMNELITTYLAGIKRVQPTGPYAIIGYSFGAIAGFEIAKIMEARGDEVRLLATLDQAPFQKERARGYDWYSVVCTLAFFLGLVEEAYVTFILPSMRLKPRAEVLDHLFSLAPPGRIEELGMLTRERIEMWADLALGLKKLVCEFDPTGVVSKMDVFYSDPLAKLVNANNAQDWFDGYISKWTPFVADIKYYYVEGGHRNLITPPHLASFVKAFKAVMDSRGL